MKKFYPVLTASLVISAFCAAQPAITSFAPITGPAGTSVTIHGTNFNPAAASNVVFFGTVQAIVSSASTDSLMVTVPDGANYQYISVTDTATRLSAYSLRPFLPTFSCGLAINTSSFSSTTDSTTGASPYGVSTGDLDGDGKPDLVFVNYTSNTISILKNTSTPGNISYGPKTDLTTGPHPVSVTIGDLDGDGKPDMVVADEANDMMSVYKNTGTPGTIDFEPKADFYSGFAPSYYALGDLNNDGKPDLVTVNICTSTITILKNISTATAIGFAAPYDFSPGFYPNHVAIGDLDGDSRPDLAVAGNAPFGTYTLFTCKNTGTGGSFAFNPGVGYSVGTDTKDVVIGDLTGDGKMDLAVTVRNSNVVAVLMNTSTGGTISLGIPTNYPAGYLCSMLAINDMNGDGKPDLVSMAYPNIVSVIRNASSPSMISFYPKVSFAAGTAAAAISVADQDADGKPDICVVSNTANTLTVLRNKECEATGISENETSQELRIYPNPFDSRTTLYFDKTVQEGSIKISDLTGKEVRSQNFSGDQLSIEKAELQAGIYFIEVSSGTGTVSKRKIIIQ
jgi:hypothetical protein